MDLAHRLALVLALLAVAAGAWAHGADADQAHITTPAAAATAADTQSHHPARTPRLSAEAVRLIQASSSFEELVRASNEDMQREMVALLRARMAARVPAAPHAPLRTPHSDVPDAPVAEAHMSARREPRAVAHAAVTESVECVGYLNFTTRAGAFSLFSYETEAECEVLIEPAGMTDDECIFLNFPHISFRLAGDSISVHDGDDWFAPVVWEADSLAMSGEVESTGDALFVQFSAYEPADEWDWGEWEAEYVVAECSEPDDGGGGTGTGGDGPVDACSSPVFLHAAAGTVDGYFPDDYPNNARCTWMIDITSEPDKCVQITFTFAGVEANFDYVYVHNEEGGLEAELTGSAFDGEVYRMPSNVATLELHTDSSFTDSGFEATYTAVECGEPVPTHTCAAHTMLTDATGAFRSSRGPDGKYYAKEDCTWEIHPAGIEPDQCVIIEFTDFSTETFDRVYVYGNADQTGFLFPSGASLQGVVATPLSVVVQNVMASVRFTSDYSVQFSGWAAQYRIGSCDEGGGGRPLADERCHNLTNCETCARAECGWCGGDDGHCVGEAEVPYCHEQTVHPGDFAGCPRIGREREVLRNLSAVLHRIEWLQQLQAQHSAEDWCQLDEIECNQFHEVTALRSTGSGTSATAVPEEMFSLHSLTLFPRLERIELRNVPLAQGVPRALGEMAHLSYIVLDGCSLTGTIPALGTHVQHLSLRDNELSGDVPWAYLASLHGADVVNLSDNKLSGTLSPLLAELPVRQLRLARNKLTGTLPDTLGGGTGALTMLELRENDLRGPLPALRVGVSYDMSINQLSSELPPLVGGGAGGGDGGVADVFMCEDCDLVGTLPSAYMERFAELRLKTNALEGTLAPMSEHLRVLNLEYNQLSGTLPADFMPPRGVNAATRSVWLSHNRLTGSIPSLHGSTIGLANNDFSGSLPAQFGEGLTSLIVSGNRLSGELPVFADAPNFFSFYAVNNQLEGTIPHGLCRLGSLRVISLASNALSGPLDALANCTHLEQLDVTNNRFSGTIPGDAFNRMTQLSSVRLSVNALEGTIPLLEHPSRIHMEQNRLEGTIPAALLQRMSLIELVVANNALHGELPPSLPVGSMLRRLDVSANALSGAVGGAFFTSELLDVDLSDNHFTSIAIGEHASSIGLVSLRASRNELTSMIRFRTSDTRAADLLMVDLSHNRITDISDLWNYLAYSSVLSINLSHNRVSGCLKNLAELTGLLTLDLSHNELSCMEPLDQHMVLENLYLGNNTLVGVLEKLDVVHNMPHLVTLDVTNTINDGSELPRDILSLAQLTQLSVRGTGLRVRDLDRCDADVTACLPDGIVLGQTVRVVGEDFSCDVPLPRKEGVLVEVDWNEYLGYTNCRCDRGHFGSRGNCSVCAHGGLCPGGQEQMIMTAQVGFWGDTVDLSGQGRGADVRTDVCGADYRETTYLECRSLQRHLCTPSLVADAREGDGEVRSETRSGNTTAVHTWRSCTTGYRGRLCSLCDHGYFMHGDECLRCPEGAGKVVMMGGFCILVVMYLVYLYVIQRSATGTLKILLFFVQMVGLLAWMGIPVSKSLSRTSVIAAPFNLLLPGPECFSDTYGFHGRFWFSTLTVPALFVLVCLIWALGYMRNIRWWRHTNVRVFLFIVLTKYMSGASTILRALPAEEPDQCRGATYFLHAPGIDMDTSASRAVHTAAAVFTVLYVVGIPFVFALVMMRVRKKLSNESVRQQLGFLYECFTPRYWYWEGVVTARRVAVAIVLTTNTYSSPIVPSAIFLILLSSAIIQRAAMPFKDPLENTMEYASLVTLCLNYALVMIFFNSTLNSTDGAAVSGLIVTLDLIMVVAIMSTLVLRKRKSAVVGKLRRLFGAGKAASRATMSSPNELSVALEREEDDNDVELQYYAMEDAPARA